MMISSSMTCSQSPTIPHETSSKVSLILASASPRRLDLLKRAGIECEVIPARVTEHEDEKSCPRFMVLHNAELKARTISERYPERLVLGADTTVALDDRVLNKPADMEEAYAMLRRLSGRTHTVYTGVCLCRQQPSFYRAEVFTSRVTFRQLSEDVIRRYCTLVNPLDKAGAYGIQEGREMIIENVEGSVENVMGLPVQELLALLP